MVNRFQRNVSFPVPKNNAARLTSYKNRSASLPVRFDSISTNLDSHIKSLKTWCCSKPSRQTPSDTWLTDGIAVISVLLASLSDLLNDPHGTDPLRKSSITEYLSEDILRLADIYQSFHVDLINMSYLQTDARAALRQKDLTRLSSTTRAWQRVVHAVSKLACAAGTAVRTKLPPLPEISTEPEESSIASLPMAICYSVSVLATASSVVFAGVAALSKESITATATLILGEMNPVRKGKVMRVWWVVDLLRWKLRTRRKLDTGKECAHALKRRSEGEIERRKDAEEKLDNWEQCIREMEISSAKIFSCLVKARVCMLNILTPT